MLSMSHVTEFLQKVRDFAALPGWSKSKLSREAGLHPNTLRGLDKPGFNPEAKTLEKLEAFISRSDQ